MSFPVRTVSGDIVNIVLKEGGEEADGLVILTDDEGNKWMRRRDADDLHAVEPYDPASFEAGSDAPDDEETEENNSEEDE